MFEQSVILENPKKASWTFVVATSLELLAITALIVTPLFFIAPPKMPPPPRTLARYLPHVKLVRVEQSNLPHERVVSRNRLNWSTLKLVAPAQIPHGVANLSDLQPVVIGEAGASGSGLPDGLASFGADPPQIAPPPQPAPKPQPKSSGLLHVSQGVQEAKLIHRVMPRYPPLAIQTREFGTVHLVAIISKDGHVSSVQVLDGPMFLRQAALEAIKQWIYKPTLLNGEPVEVLAPIDVHFTLSN
ncbi:MAG TPA: energy transducer TonB [Bryobacteraceae bacterium]|jgi:protein TonB|nr:energy transducer TonB [Bryobacteraceae bacterium]